MTNWNRTILRLTLMTVFSVIGWILDGLLAMLFFGLSGGMIISVMLEDESEDDDAN